MLTDLLAAVIREWPILGWVWAAAFAVDVTLLRWALKRGQR